MCRFEMPRSTNSLSTWTLYLDLVPRPDILVPRYLTFALCPLPFALRHARHINLASIVDSVTEHRDALESIADSDGRVARGIAAEVSDDPVAEDTPGHDLGP